jgi:hypothetical protein
MRTFSVFILITAILSVHPVISFAKGKTDKMKYTLSVQIDPEYGSIIGAVEIDNPSDSVFLLTKGMEIQSVVTKGKTVSFIKNVAETNPNSVEVTLNYLPEEMTITYSGNIKADDYPKAISNLNRMTRDMLELTDLIDWYPRMRKGSPFNYSLTVDAPSDFELITNGSLVKQSERDGRKVNEWESFKQGYSISLMGSTGLKKSVAETNGYKLEIYYSKLPGSYIDSMKANLIQTLQLYTNLYQSKGSNNLVRIIYSPRSAGGYARGSIIVVSEEFALEQMINKFGYARDFHLNAHEIAHLWSKAKTDTPDDWINEGLAEYSAFFASEKIIGIEFSTLLLNEYLGIIENTATQNSILETTNDSWERDINRYYKPTVLLDSIRQKYGEITIFQLIRSLDATFRSQKTATTRIFLDVLKQTTGSETQSSFYNALNRKQWSIKKEKTNDRVDAVFLGTWIGRLTQFGTTTKFVFNLKQSENSEIIPTLDSPDQNAFGIPASDLTIDGNNISYRVGVASAGYKGNLDRNTMTISGTWTQRGVDYPLLLSKQTKDEK